MKSSATDCMAVTTSLAEWVEKPVAVAQVESPWDSRAVIDAEVAKLETSALRSAGPVTDVPLTEPISTLSVEASKVESPDTSAFRSEGLVTDVPLTEPISTLSVEASKVESPDTSALKLLALVAKKTCCLAVVTESTVTSQSR